MRSSQACQTMGCTIPQSARAHSSADVHLILGRQMTGQRLAARAVVQPLVDVGVAVEAEQTPAARHTMVAVPASRLCPVTMLTEWRWTSSCARRECEVPSSQFKQKFARNVGDLPWSSRRAKPCELHGCRLTRSIFSYCIAAPLVGSIGRRAAAVRELDSLARSLTLTSMLQSGGSASIDAGHRGRAPARGAAHDDPRRGLRGAAVRRR